MSRRMSCSMTIDAVRARTKTVTRRHVDTWRTLRPGDRLTLIERGMGLPEGARQVVLAEVEVVDVRVEPLGLADEAEVAAEGFSGDDPMLWRCCWASEHGYRIPAGIDDPDDVLAWVDTIEVRRIEWRYLDDEVDPKTLTPGSVVRHRDGSLHVLDHRKADRTGWWLRDAGGLADRAWASGDWEVVPDGD